MSNNELDFENIFNTYKPKIYRYLTRLIGADEAEDTTQEVFIKINHGLQNFSGKSKLSTWIYRIATNAALDKIRSSTFKRSKDLIREEDLIAEDKAIGTGKKVLSMDQKLIEKEMNVCIRNFIYNLPENYRTVLVLSELEVIKNQEIAEILGITLDTVKIRLHRGRAHLKKELERHCDFYRTKENQLACEPTKTTPKFE
jgi:RNA polymerase sigma-70 factor (ECF subfamily)